MEQISIPLRSMDICSISESCFLTCFEFWVENVSRDIDNIIPSVVVGMCDTILIKQKSAPLNMKKVLKQLFALNMIKAHWVLTNEIRYRPQKRIGKTRRRYITFYKRELIKFIAKECLGE